MTEPTSIPQLISVYKAASKLQIKQAAVLALCEQHGVEVSQFGKALRIRESDVPRLRMLSRRPTERELAGRIDVSYRLAEAEILGDVDATKASPESPDDRSDDASTSA